MMSSAAEPHWYLVHCRARQDGRALEHLERQGYECFRPMRSVERLWGGRRYPGHEALFPNYLFVRLNRTQDNWAPIRSSRGVNRIVSFDGQPCPVGDKLIAAIRARVAAQGLQEPCLKPGERVRISEGPFAPLEAIFVAHDGEARVVLLLNILQTEQALSFPLRSVRKIS